MPTTTSTILFTDAVGSTELRAELGETAADTLFRDHERALQDVVSGHGGKVVKTAGDGVMAAFDSSTDAVQAVVAIQQRITRDFPMLRIRTGLAVGDVSWEDGDCFGMPVVTAARLQAQSAPGQILVTAMVRWLAGDRSGAHFRSVGPLELKGIPDAVETFEVQWTPLDPVDAIGGSFAVPLPSPIAVAPGSVFVGREGEWSALGEIWEAVRHGERRTALVGGEAGAGKTRLAFEFARHVASGGAAVAYGACDAELAVPYQPFVHALDHLVRAMPAEVRTQLMGELAEVSLLLPQLERMVPGLRRAPAADPETERYRVFQAVDALLSELARERPILVLVDDLHWGGSQTLALFRHLARSSTPSKLLIMATFRDTAKEIASPLANCLAELRRTDTARRVSLVGFDAAGVEDFVARAVGHELDADLRAVAATLSERSGGNAFYLGELWRHLVMTGQVAKAGDRWTVHMTEIEAGVPESVREVESARLATLSAPARELVELMAIGGQWAERRVLAAASAPGPDDALDNALDELVDAKLLVEVGGTLGAFQFAHAIVRDTVVQTVRPSMRARLHKRLAEAIESVYEADRRPKLADLARHFAAAADLGVAAKAVYYSRRAGAQAMRSVSYDEAVAHLRTALELSEPGRPETIDLQLELGEAYTRLGEHHTAMEVFDDAFRTAHAAGLVDQTVRAAVGFDFAVQMPGLPGDESVRMLSDALALVGDEDSPLRARVQASLALALSLTGRMDDAKRIGDEALAAARRHGDVEVLMGALQCAAIYEQDAPRYLDLTIELCDLAVSLGDTWVFSFARGAVIRGYVILGRVAEARGALPALRQASERGRYVVYRFQAMAWEVIFALMDGRLDDAERMAEAASEFGAAARTEFDAGVYGVQMYAIRREQGRLAEVAPAMRMAAALQQDQPVWRPGLAALFADVGMFDDARREFDLMASNGFATVPRDATWPGSLTYLAEVCRALGDAEQAAVLYDELQRFRGLTMQVGFTVNLGPADRLLGNLAVVMGQRSDAERHFEAALAMAVAAASPLWIARIKYDWAVGLGDRPDLLADARSVAHQFQLGDLIARIEALGPVMVESRVGSAGASPPSPAPSRTGTLPDGLSAREVEVLRLVANGRSNREIGEQLFISTNTVANHVRAILQKTGSANRAEATAYAARHGLLA